MKKIKIVTIGGGSSYTPELCEGFIKRFNEMPIKEWVLVDVEEGRGKNEIILALVKRMFEKAGIDINVRSAYKLDGKVLKDANYVTTQLRVGRQQARQKDEEIAFKHGMIGQETNGIGGQFKAMRTIPVIKEIVNKVKKYCDGAWIINFTNPSGMVAQAINDLIGYKKFIGVCNIPIHTRIGVSNMWKTNLKNIKTDAAGLNHMVFFTKFYLNNKDVTKKTLEMALNPKLNKELTVKNISKEEWNPNFIKALGVLPCSYHKYYYKRGFMLKKGLNEYNSATGVRATQVMEIEKKLFDHYKDIKLNYKPKELEERGGAYYSDVACGVIKAIHTNSMEEYTVNVINNGKIKNLPNDWTVEVTCKIGKNGPIKVDRDIILPTSVLPLIFAIKEFEFTVIKSIEAKSKKLGLLAAATNPLSEDDFVVEKAFDELMVTHSKYIPKYN